MGISRSTTQSPRGYDQSSAPGNTATRSSLRTRLQDFGYLFRIHPSETTAGFAEADLTFGYLPFDIRRYGADTDASDNTTAINNASLAAKAIGGTVYIPQGQWTCTGELLLRDSVRFRGDGPEISKLLFSGSSTYGFTPEASSGTRTFNQGIRDLTLSNTGTRTTGINLDSVSTSEFVNVIITSFTNALGLNSPVAGDCVYNRFFYMTSNDCTNGFLMQGNGSNANIFVGCRFNGATHTGTTAFNIDNGNGNQFIGTHIDVVGAAFLLTASAGAGFSDSNVILGSRIEDCTGDVYNLGTNVRYTQIAHNDYENITGTIYVDNGTRNNICDPPNIFRQDYAGANSANGDARWQRSADGGDTLPAFVFADTVAGTQKQLTLQISNESTTSGAKYWRGVTGGTEKCSDDTTGKATRSGLVLTAATVAAGGSQIAVGNSNQTTVGTAGGASALPATPSGYWKINVAGTDFVVPYYKAS